MPTRGGAANLRAPSAAPKRDADREDSHYLIGTATDFLAFAGDRSIHRALMFKCGRASVSYVFALKQEKWDGLSEQDKAALDGTSGADAAGLMGRTLDAEEWEANIGAHNAGVSFYSTTGVVLAQAREDFTAAEKVWVGQAKSAGMKPPLAVLAALRREIHHQDNA